MGLIISNYRKNYLRRFDKDGAIPYYSAADFPGLDCAEGAFENSSGVTVRYYTYSYEGYDEKKLLLFCPGIGPGHTAYLSEIETLCRAGCKVLTLDYTGCGSSGGERLPSINAPTRDATELLELLHPREELTVIGHSLGGYTALNLAHLTPAVKKAVILSGFVSISDELMGYVKLRPLANIVKRYEKKLDLRLGSIDNRAYLASTTDKLLWFHSTDDPMVNYKYNAGQVLKLNNPNVRVVTVEGKKHNPQYSAEALGKMNAWMGGYYRLIREGELQTPEARKEYFADKPIGLMTAQDPAVYEEILRFIREEERAETEDVLQMLPSFDDAGGYTVITVEDADKNESDEETGEEAVEAFVDEEADEAPEEEKPDDETPDDEKDDEEPDDEDPEGSVDGYDDEDGGYDEDEYEDEYKDEDEDEDCEDDEDDEFDSDDRVDEDEEMEELLFDEALDDGSFFD